MSAQARARARAALPHRPVCVSVPVREVGGGSNTPLTLTTGCDWMSGTTLLASPDDLITTLQCFYQGAPFQTANRGLYGYESGVVFPNGTWVCWSDGRPDVFVSLPGDACDELGLQSLVAFKEMHELRLSRFDVFIDGAPFKAAWLADRYRESAIRTPAQKGHLHDSLTPDGHDTFTLGSRRSQRFLRCYDRNFDADGNQVTRIEIEYKHARAQLVFEEVAALADLDRDFPVLAIGLLRDFMDVIDPIDSNISRCPLNSMWEHFTGALAKVKTIIPRTKNTLEKSIEWLTEAVAPTLATVTAFYDQTGHDANAWLADLLKTGASKMQDIHRWKLDTALYSWEVQN